MDQPHFFPLNANICGQSNPIKDKETKYLTEDHVKHIYEKIELRSVLNIDTDTMKPEIEQDLNRLNDTTGGINKYQELIVNNAKKHDKILS